MEPGAVFRRLTAAQTVSGWPARLSEGTSLQGEEVEVTVMLVDVRSFTGSAERGSAPGVVAALNGRSSGSCRSCASTAATSTSSWAAGCSPSRCAAAGGAPRGRRAGDRAGGGRGPLEVGIGMNSGQVVAGNVGGARRLEFSVVGDAVNVTARVEAAPRVAGDRIIAARRARELAGDGFAFGERAAGQLKGKRDPVSLYAVAAQ